MEWHRLDVAATIASPTAAASVSAAVRAAPPFSLGYIGVPPARRLCCCGSRHGTCCRPALRSHFRRSLHASALLASCWLLLDILPPALPLPLSPPPSICWLATPRSLVLLALQVWFLKIFCILKYSAYMYSSISGVLSIFLDYRGPAYIPGLAGPCLYS
jgi:hypothetical protein